ERARRASPPSRRSEAAHPRGAPQLSAHRRARAAFGSRPTSGIIGPGGLNMGFLAGKRAFIVGVATDRSIAWGIAQARHREGCELAFSYVNDKMKERVEPLAQSLGSRLTMPLDVTVDGQIDAAYALLEREWGALDVVVHAVAFAPREALTGT